MIGEDKNYRREVEHEKEVSENQHDDNHDHHHDHYHDHHHHHHDDHHDDHHHLSPGSFVGGTLLSGSGQASTLRGGRDQ